MSWCVYLLHNDKLNRTYIGATTDPNRRIRQHNRELVGGARSTSSGAPNWRIVAYLEGFLSRKEAYRWEKLLKVRCTGYHQRLVGMVAVSWGICPIYRRTNKRRQGVLYQVPTGLSLKLWEEPAE